MILFKEYCKPGKPIESLSAEVRRLGSLHTHYLDIDVLIKHFQLIKYVIFRLIYLLSSCNGCLIDTRSHIFLINYLRHVTCVIHLIVLHHHSSTLDCILKISHPRALGLFTVTRCFDHSFDVRSSLHFYPLRVQK